MTSNAITNTSSVVPATAPIDGFVAMVERASRDPSIDLDKLDRLLSMHEREYARIAALRYNEAMSACQAAMEPIRAD
jgi:hypothetical protein